MKNIIITLTLLVLSIESHGFGELMQSAKVLRRGEYNVSAMAQSYSSTRSGLNLSGVLDLPFTEQTNLRFTGGMGSYDFNLGAAMKWVPIAEGSKSIVNFGAVASAEFGRDNSLDSFLFKASPFVSKKFTWEHGHLEPYASIPVGLITFDSLSKFSTQLTLGTHVKFEELNYMSFSVEGGFKIKNAESYIAFMATLQLQK